MISIVSLPTLFPFSSWNTVITRFQVSPQYANGPVKQAMMPTLMVRAEAFGTNAVSPASITTSAAIDRMIDLPVLRIEYCRLLLGRIVTTGLWTVNAFEIAPHGDCISPIASRRRGQTWATGSLQDPPLIEQHGGGEVA